MEMIDSLNRMINMKVKDLGRLLRGRETPDIFNEKMYQTGSSSEIEEDKSQIQHPRRSHRKNLPK